MLARQVLVEAQLIDVSLNDQFQYGVDWNLLKNRVAGIVGDAPINLDPISGSLPGANHDSLGRLLTIPRQTIGTALGRGTGIGYVGDTFSTALNVLRSFGHVKVLSNPSVRVRNGTPAYLSVGRNIRYVSKSTTSFSNPGGGATNTSSDVQTESLFAGVVIGVAPLIRNDGNVELLVHPMQTEVDEASLALVEVGNGNSVTLPRISFKGMTTTLNLRDGNTVLIGGLIDQQDQNTDNERARPVRRARPGQAVRCRSAHAQEPRAGDGAAGDGDMSLMFAALRTLDGERPAPADAVPRGRRLRRRALARRAVARCRRAAGRRDRGGVVGTDGRTRSSPAFAHDGACSGSGDDGTRRCSSDRDRPRRCTGHCADGCAGGCRRGDAD